MADTRGFLGRGFCFPPRVDPATGRFCMVDAEEDIRQSIYIILMNRMGERAMLPDFGSRIHDYVFELPDQTAENLIATEIVDALARWEPRIVDTEVEVDESGVREGKLLFNIRYTVRDTNNPNNLVFPYYLYEGVGQD